MMSETPDEWLERLFEFNYCDECGKDAEDHEVCVVPGTGTNFARCLRTNEGNVFDDDSLYTGDRA
jgi:hypothetical protein